MAQDEWWRGAVIYQIYPRSFKDSNNDGIGDIPGITENLEYVADLGVDGIWISPFFTSPMKDFGYDVSDYRDIDPLFGTLGDFDEMLEKAHKLGLKIIIDLVLSHTSEEHPWFSDPAKKDWYVWADAKTNEQGERIPPNNWVSVFGGSAWEWDKRYQQYYLHNFLKEQPDLNYHNEDVQAEILDTARFWLDRGVDGFRLDTVNFYFHDQKLRDNPPKRDDHDGYATQFEADVPYSAQSHIYDKSQAENLVFVERLRALTDEYDGRFLVGEIGDDDPYGCAQEYTKGFSRLHTAYNTHLMSGTEKLLTPQMIMEPLKRFFETQEAPLTDEAWCSSWPSWAFSNHDVVRVASRWHKLYEHNPDLSVMINVLLLCLPGTIFMYQGEELGLPEAEIPFEQLQDPWAKETWPIWQGRDGCRTPFPWQADITNNGFSLSAPWLPIPHNHNTLSPSCQVTDQRSALSITSVFIEWRKGQRNLVKGKYQFIETNNSNILHFTRSNHKYETNCIFNFSDQEQTYKGHEFAPYGFHIDGFNIEK